MKKRICLLGLCTAVVLTWISTADALTIGVEPSSQAVSIGDSVDVDITISDLEVGTDEIVSAYALVIGYDQTILSVSEVAYGSYLGFSLSSSDPNYNPGELFVSELSFSGDMLLAASQPDSFVLATLTFDALAGGASDLQFLDYIPFGVNLGIDVKGRLATILDLDVGSGSIVVSGDVPIPEPATLLLLTTGVLMSAGFYRRRQHGC